MGSSSTPIVADPGCQTRPPWPPTGDFSTIYGEHFDMVWRAVRRFGVPDAAVEDAVQDVFLVVYRRLGDFEGRSTLRTWLYGIALRVARDHRRRVRRKGGLDELPADLKSRSTGPLEAATRSEAVRVMYQLLAALDEKHRELFVLVELEDMTVRAAAELIGLPEQTAYSRLKAARERVEKAAARYRRTPSGESHE